MAQFLRLFYITSSSEPACLATNVHKLYTFLAYFFSRLVINLAPIRERVPFSVIVVISFIIEVLAMKS